MDRMNTRRNRPNYFLLNDGLDEETSPEDRLGSYENVFTLENDILPSESASQIQQLHFESLAETQVEESSTIQTESSASLVPLQESRQHARISEPKSTKWPWTYFEISEFENPWIVKKSNKRKLIDREIRCTVLDEETGEKCGWKTTDSKRQASTGNMIDHLRKQHSIDPPNKPDEPKRAEYSILSLIKGKERLTHQQLLEKNILRWIVAEKQPFTTLESPAFQQIFLDIPGIRLPFTSRQVVRQRLADDFATQRVQLNEELSKTCKTIAISLDVWTSKNSLPILGIIGHWLTSEFQYQERALDFRELHGSHSGENLAAAVQATLEELHLERKLIAITGDNASNNEKMISVLYENLQKKVGSLRFRGLESYVRCLAHILNLIVKDILSALKSGTAAEAFSACDTLSRQDPRCLENQGVLAKLRILAVWIDRSPQRRQKWKEVCHFLDLPDKFIEYDNDTRWNSTYRMLADSLQAKVQINKYLEHQVELSLPSFTDNDWEWLRQIHGVLSKFNELTLFVSKKRPQISLSVAIYYELHDLLHDASEQRGSFSKLDMDIALAVKNGMKKYKKYYTFMDEVDTYYTALVLDPRVKGDLIRQELSEDDDAGRLILEAIRLELHREYNITEVNSPPTEQFLPDNQEYSDPELRMLRKLQPPSQSFASDIDRYFESPRAVVTDSKNPNWLCDWWRRHKDEYPQMAMAARDYLAIPASEVSVERMFNAGRDILGVRRFAMKGETMRMLMLMDSMEKNL